MESFPIIRYEVNQSLVTDSTCHRTTDAASKSDSTLEELCQAASSPPLLSTLYLLFPMACLGFYGYIRIDITRTDDQGF